MDSMFRNATNFNQNLGSWYVALSNTAVKFSTNTIGDIAAPEYGAGRP